MIEAEARYLKDSEVSKLVGLSVQTLRNERHNGTGIPYIKKGGAVRYFLPDVYAYMQSLRVVPFRNAEAETEG